MPAPIAVEPDIHWTEHFARYGFAVVPGLLDREFCGECIRHIAALIGHNLPASQWTNDNTPVLHHPFFEGGNAPEPVLERVFEQPRLRAAIEILYGGPGHWDGMKNYYLFLKPHNPKGRATLTKQGHIDFGNQRVPPLYRGFTFQALLHDNEPLSGNLTLHPGSHRTVQKVVMAEPEHQFKSGLYEGVQPPPFEFVGRAGDVCFMHHIVLHSGNDSYSQNRLPRVALHGEAFRTNWLREIDPAKPNLSPWERSLAHNGPYREPPAVEEEQMIKRQKYVEDLKTTVWPPKPK
ncbi:MAG: phytanoyl-CoA dioxygenase family protein [Planctomycetes bacterium]|nr:phytanoyl-CoA dioxygenase family protein [Planctomycetota bacterium]